MIAAVIDLGSNSLRMGVYIKQNGALQMLHQERYPTRLSENLATDDLLKENAMRRTLEGFSALRASLAAYPSCVVKCVATAALRRAKNAAYFCNRVLEETGFVIEIIDGAQEAEYGLFGALLSAKTDSFYMLDTGGGSFEVVLCQAGKLAGNISLPYGAVVLTETFQPDRNGTEQIFSFVSEAVESIPFVAENQYPIVLLGGANRMLGNMYTLSNGIPWQDGLSIPSEKAKQLMRRIIDTPIEARMELVGMEKNRADIITAGLMPIAALMQHAKSKALILSVNSIREGIANALLREET